MSTFVIDKMHSEATFQVRHLVTKVRGHFTDLSGTIQFDAAHPDQSSISLTIGAASIDTGTPDRDAHLRSPTTSSRSTSSPRSRSSARVSSRRATTPSMSRAR